MEKIQNLTGEQRMFKINKYLVLCAIQLMYFVETKFKIEFK